MWQHCNPGAINQKLIAMHKHKVHRDETVKMRKVITVPCVLASIEIEI